ncbi:MAG: hypothetical protein KC983_03910 [Phycisphaerales bacterium]|nr:hypothetical protein [Phycisphaerales bacterium]
MAIKTRLTPSYSIRMILIAALSFVFGIWGIYDAQYRLPALEKRANDYQAAQQTFDELKAKETRGQRLNADERAAKAAAYDTINELSPNGEVPEAPSKWDKILWGWMFVACIPIGIWYLIAYLRQKKLSYTLDDDGTLHLPGGRSWTRSDIASIDMSNWMRKSVAEVVHQDGTREKLDDFIHKDTYKIVGTIAHERFPDQWHADAKPVKDDETVSVGTPAPAEAPALKDETAA